MKNGVCARLGIPSESGCRRADPSNEAASRLRPDLSGGCRRTLAARGRRSLAALALLALWLGCGLLTGCARPLQPEDLAEKAYVCQREGFGGDFLLWLFADGSFCYYEGKLSSYIGSGSWQLQDGVVTLQDDTGAPYDFVNRFSVKRGKLVFLAEGSTNFLYCKLEDGDAFVPSPEIGTPQQRIAPSENGN